MFPRLRERRGSRGTDLSGGEQQMLAIARALVRDPKLLLLDEPFEGLAPIIVRDLLATCRALAEAGQTILVVEQNISAAMSLADRIYVLNNGHMVEELAAPAVRAQPEVLHRHLGVLICLDSASLRGVRSTPKQSPPAAHAQVKRDCFASLAMTILGG
jgi:branched-chain amino acid transport system ATP-binding protein